MAAPDGYDGSELEDSEDGSLVESELDSGASDVEATHEVNAFQGM